MNGARESATQDAGQAVDIDGHALAAWSALSKQSVPGTEHVKLADVTPRAWRAPPPAEPIQTRCEVIHGAQPIARRRWRPVARNDLRRLQERIESFIRTWLRVWLPQPGAVRGHIRDRSNAMPGSVRPLLHSEELTIAVRNSALTSLAWRALDMARLEHESVDEATRAVVAAMAEHMGRDLECRLRMLVAGSGLATPGAGGNGSRLHRIDIDADQFTSMIEVSVTEDYFRHVLPPPVRDRSYEMSDRLHMEAALQASTLSLRGVLGTCALRLGRFLNLQSGDLLVLNRALHDPLPLYLDGRPQGPIACGTVGKVRGRLALKLNHVEETRDE